MEKLRNFTKGLDDYIEMTNRDIDSLQIDDTSDPIIERQLWEMRYPQYLGMGCSVFSLTENNSFIRKVPSLEFDAEFVSIGADLPESVVQLSEADLEQRRVGVSVKVSMELWNSSSEATKLGFVKQGVIAVNEAVTDRILESILAVAPSMTFTQPAREMLIDMQEAVGKNGVFYGGNDVTVGMKNSTATGKLPLYKGP